MAEVTDRPIEIVLGDGSKIVGATLDEALKNAAKRIEDRGNDIKQAQEKAAELQRQVDGYKQSEEERRAEQDRQAALERQKKSQDAGTFSKERYYQLLNEDPSAANDYWFEHKFGQKPEDVVATFNYQNRTLGEINQERVASNFWRQHPEFPPEINAAKSLDKRVGQLLNEGHPFNVRTFNMAYEELISEETIKPMELDDKGEKKKDKSDEAERPNPSLNGAGSTAGDDAEARKMENMDEKALEAYGREKGWLR
jgi:hypothetical protein